MSPTGTRRSPRQHGDERRVEVLRDRLAGLGHEPGAEHRQARADLAEVAGRHGWYDQSHPTADFRRVLGTTPAQYARRARPAAAP